MEQHQTNPSDQEPGKSGTQQQGNPILVPQQGEIKNNDQDPGAGDRSLANEAGGKQREDAH